jgi:hypothetical protein
MKLPWLKKPRQPELEFEETSSFFLLLLVRASNASVERELFVLLQIDAYIPRNLTGY